MGEREGEGEGGCVSERAVRSRSTVASENSPSFINKERAGTAQATILDTAGMLVYKYIVYVYIHINFLNSPWLVKHINKEELKTVGRDILACAHVCKCACVFLGVTHTVGTYST